MWGDKPKTSRRRPAKKKKPAASAKKFSQSPTHVSQQRILQQTKVYVMHNIPIFWLNKFGITDHTAARRRNVSETTPGYVFHFFAPTLEFGWQIEQFVHRLYKLQNVHFWTGSGRTEWFIVFSPIVGTLVICGSVYWDISLTWKQYALGFFTPFVWLDGLFWLALFWFGRIILFCAAMLAFCWFIAHAK